MPHTGGFTGASWSDAVARCPKSMLHGPCAGVGADGDCEVPGVGACSFLAALDSWPYPPPPVEATGPAGADDQVWDVGELTEVAARRPVIVADLPAAALSADSLLDTAEILAPAVDACLLGDHGGARVQFPPSYRSGLLTRRGIAVWVGVNCRDRNRVALAGEVAACLDAGVTGVHCVTGDHPALGHRDDAPGVFDLDSLDVVALARGHGAHVSVAHAPAAPPTAHRLSRLMAKIDAGADTVFVDHCGGPGPVGEAVAGLRATGFTGLVLACVPVVTSAATAAVVASFAGPRLPAGFLDAIVNAPDPTAAGITATARLATRMLALPGVDGVNLSGGAQPGHERAAAQATAAIANRVFADARRPT
ncbi:methylenetetrahydrofolate reductase C-terminal domain-containing protein [Frankia sp. AgPm24]|uniref:methylenetetrahydrofolate reductase C-terminal domain-containing protein n=1 Tax=Frankia sp. AgPm24 TaxID=631128 RepID=UPI00200F633D|nr:methylenetetrahydrofolate reductase C-terminal domain-containing protein [Frankia sp. AgPm24]